MMSDVCSKLLNVITNVAKKHSDSTSNNIKNYVSSNLLSVPITTLDAKLKSSGRTEINIWWKKVLIIRWSLLKAKNVKTKRLMNLKLRFEVCVKIIIVKCSGCIMKSTSSKFKCGRCSEGLRMSIAIKLSTYTRTEVCHRVCNCVYIRTIQSQFRQALFSRDISMKSKITRAVDTCQAQNAWVLQAYRI